MKKIFTLILMTLAIVTGANAENLWTGSNALGNWDWATRVTIDGASFANVQPGATLTFTFTDVQDGAQFAIKDCNNWSDLLIGAGYENVSGTSASIQLTGVQLTAIKDNGFGLQGKNATITSIDYENPATAASANSIWVGEFAASYSDAKFAKAAYFANAKANDVIRFVIKDKTSDFNGKILYQDSDNGYAWVDFTELESTKDVRDSYFEVTITDGSLATLQKYGIGTSGVGYTLTEIDYISGTTQDASILWEGETAADWSNSIKIAASKFSSAKVGDKLQITVKDVETSNQLFAKNNWDDAIGSNQMIFGTGETTAILGVTKQLLENAKLNGLAFSGQGVTVTEIKLIEGEGHENSLWFGEFAVNSDHNACEFYCPTDVGNATHLVVTLNQSPSWFQMLNPSWETVTTTPEKDGNTYKYELTDEIKGLLSKFILQGGGAKVTSIDLVYPTSINNITVDNADKNAPIYNLAGQRVGESYKGIVIQNGKKTVKK